MSVVKYYTEFYSQNKTEWKIQIIDTDVSTGTPIELQAANTGFTIDYDRGITDVLIGGIVKSELQMYIYNDNSNFNSFLNSSLQNAEEGRYLIKLFKNSSFEWGGPLLNDFSSMEDANDQIVTLTATDGLALLKDIEFTETSSSFINYFFDGLKELEYKDFWGSSDDWILTYINWFDNRVNTSEDILTNIKVDEDIFIEVKEKEGYKGTVEEINKLSYYDLFTLILEHFAANLVLIRGSWHIIQITELDNTSISCYSYNTIEGTNTKKTVTLKATPDDRSEGNISYIPALKEVRCDYKSFDNGNLLTDDLSFSTTYNIRNVSAGTGNFIHLGGEFLTQVYLSGNVQGSTTFKFEIKIVGTSSTYYYKNTSVNGTGAWSTGIGTYDLSSNVVVGVQYDTLVSALQFNFYTQDIPIDGALSVKFTVDSGSTLQSNANVSTVSNSIVIAALKYIINNDQPADYVTVKAVNSRSYSLINELNPNLYGTSGSGKAKGVIQTDSSGFDDSGNSWGVGSSGSKNFNELLVYELLGLQSYPKLVFSGKILKDTVYIDFLNTIILAYDSTNYNMIANRVSYSDDEISGDWIEFDSDKFTLSTSEVENLSNINVISNLELVKQQSILNEDTGDIDTKGGDILTGTGGIDTEGGTIDTNGAAISTDNGEGTKGAATVGDLSTDGTVNLANIPTSKTGLSIGDVWRDEEFLKIVIS